LGKIKRTYRKRNLVKKGQLDARMVEVVRSIAGEEAIGLVNLMRSEKNDVSEIKIMKKTKLDIHLIRNLLYKLHSNNLADYRRVRDNKNGIYISYWKFNKEVAKLKFTKLKQEKLNHFRERLAQESGNAEGFFICPSACERSEFSKAMQQNFRCQECGQLMGQQNNSATINFLKGKIREMETAA
jgi:transcription initiation factor TFIIE subunit alpha